MELIHLTYREETVRQIEWDKLLTSDIFSIADIADLHPILGQ